MVVLKDYQIDAVKKMHDGCILVGGTGSGKTITSLYFYGKNFWKKDLYVITTAKKRDTHDWEDEASKFDGKITIKVVDSWNNIEKYINIKNAFFIFDEQHASGYGKWGKSFIKIAQQNNWITLSATPADNYSDLMCHFIAKRWFRNKTDFTNRHVVYSKFAKFPQIDHYIDTKILDNYKQQLYVIMADQRKTTQHHQDIICEYDKQKYKMIFLNRWNIYEDEPIQNASELCSCLRKVTNTSSDRITKCMELIIKHKKVIIFYNFDYELELLRDLCDGIKIEYAELNGHRHEEIPTGNQWVYLVQYFNSEAWNCITCDTIIFFSQSYSYRSMIQAAGRIDRANTPYTELYYYHLISHAVIDMSIKRCLHKKKNFNESRFVKNVGGSYSAKEKRKTSYSSTNYNFRNRTNI